MDKRIREAIDACRPDSDDLLADDLADVARAIERDPELKTAHDRIARWDRAIRSAMDDVAVPADLAERLLMRLGGEPNAGGAPPIHAADSATHVVVLGQDSAARPSVARTLMQRRYWAGASLAAIAASLLVAGLGYWMQTGSDLPLDQLVVNWQTELADDAWRAADTTPRGFPVSDAVRVPPSRWQWIGRLTPNPVVAYELVQGQSKATLYAARMSRQGLRTAPPMNPQTGGQGQAIGYWHAGDIVYVLVVPDARAYRGFLRASPASLAWQWRTGTRPATDFSATARKIV